MNEILFIFVACVGSCAVGFGIGGTYWTERLRKMEKEYDRILEQYWDLYGQISYKKRKEKDIDEETKDVE